MGQRVNSHFDWTTRGHGRIAIISKCVFVLDGPPPVYQRVHVDAKLSLITAAYQVARREIGDLFAETKCLLKRDESERDGESGRRRDLSYVLARACHAAA